MKRLRRIGLRLTVLLLTTSATLLLLEIGLRFTRYRQMLFAPPRYYFRADPRLGYDLQENAPRMTHTIADTTYPIWTNELGCFDQPYQGERDPILLVGDSFAHYYAPFEEKWGTRLEQLLGQRVLKCGVSGFGTRQEFLKAEALLPRISPPRLILVAYFWNDFRDDVLHPEETVIDGWRVTSVKFRDVEAGTIGPTRGRQVLGYWLRLNSIVYNLGKRAFEGYKQGRVDRQVALRTDFDLYPGALYQAPYPWVKPALETHLQGLLQFRQLARSVNAQLCIVLFPAKQQVYPSLLDSDDPSKSHYDQATRLVQEFLEKNGVSVISLPDLFAPFADTTPKTVLDVEKDLFWPVDFHINVRGNRLAALLIARHLLQHNLVSTSDPAQRLAEIEHQLTDFTR